VCVCVCVCVLKKDRFIKAWERNHIMAEVVEGCH
jgi:hypothetical protein